jgi:hypothetical protein
MYAAVVDLDALRQNGNADTVDPFAEICFTVAAR